MDKGSVLISTSFIPEKRSPINNTKRGSQSNVGVLTHNKIITTLLEQTSVIHSTDHSRSFQLITISYNFECYVTVIKQNDIHYKLKSRSHSRSYQLTNSTFPCIPRPPYHLCMLPVYSEPSIILLSQIIKE